MRFSLSSVVFLALSSISSAQSSPADERRQTTETCATDTVPSFNLQARYKDDSTTTPVHILTVNIVPHMSYYILTAVGSSFTYNNLTTGAIRGFIDGNPYLIATSYSLYPADSAVFISIQYPPKAWSGYCFFPGVVPAAGPYYNLGAHGRSDQWSRCRNSTASGRLDVVYAAISGHPHYNIDNCRRGVWLGQI